MRWLWMLALACHSVEERAPPPLGPGASLLWISAPRDGATKIEAMPREAEPPAYLRRGPITHYAVTYACSLMELGLQPGPQTLKNEVGAMELPAPTSVLSSEVGTEDGTWRSYDPWAALPSPLDTLLTQLPIETGTRCGLDRGRVIASPQGVRTNVEDALLGVDSAVPLSDGSTLLTARHWPDLAFTSTIGYGVYRLEGERLEPIDVPGGPFLASHADGDEVWLVSADRVVRGNPAIGFTTVTTTISQPGFTEMALTASKEGPLTLWITAFSAQRDGPSIPEHGVVSVLKVTATEIKTIYRGQDVQRGGLRLIAPAWVSANEVLVAGLRPNDNGFALRIQDDVAVPITLPASGPVTWLGVVAGWGPVFTTENGPLYQRVANSWEVRFQGLPRFTRYVFSYEDELWVLTSVEVRVLRAGYPDCPATRVANFAATLMPLPDGVLVFDRTGAAGNMRLVSIRRDEPPACGSLRDP